MLSHLHLILDIYAINGASSPRNISYGLMELNPPNLRTISGVICQ